MSYVFDRFISAFKLKSDGGKLARKGKGTHRTTLRFPKYIWDFIQSFRKPDDYPEGEVPSSTEVILNMIRAFNMQMNRTQAQIIEAIQSSKNPLDMLEKMGGPMEHSKETAPEPDATPPDEPRSE